MEMDLGDACLMNEEEKQEAMTRFECNICLEIATEPVITRCGHLYWYIPIFSKFKSYQKLALYL
jgi:E3 ubiquitin-protein ligase RNF5